MTDDMIIEIGTPIYDSPKEQNPLLEEKIGAESEKEFGMKSSSEEGYFFLKTIIKQLKNSGKSHEKVLENLEEYLICYEEHNKA
jgi:hypothetical protein